MVNFELEHVLKDCVIRFVKTQESKPVFRALMLVHWATLDDKLDHYYLTRDHSQVLPHSRVICSWVVKHQGFPVEWSTDTAVLKMNFGT